MPYFKTGYNTTMGRIVDSRKVDFGLKEALIKGGLSNRTMGVERIEDRKAVFVVGEEEEATIPPFIHPYLIEEKGQSLLISDLRWFRVNGDRWQSDAVFERSVRNRAEYNLVKSRAVLNLLWLSDEHVKLRTQFKFAGAVYAAWLSQAISRTYGLDYEDQMRIMALSVYFYHLLFTPDKRLTGSALDTAVIHTISATKLPSKDVYTLFEGLGEMDGISDFCEVVKTVVENVRLKDFNLVMLLTLIRNTWYGNSAKDLIAVSLEHPPTWVSLVYAVLTERGYRASPLYKLIEVQAKRGNAEEFRLNYQAFFRDTVVALETEDVGLVFPDFKD